MSAEVALPWDGDRPLRPLAALANDPLDAIRQAILVAAERLPGLAGDVDRLAQGGVQVRTLARDLKALQREVDAALIDAMGDERQVEVPHVGRVERYTSKDRRRWDSEGILSELIRQALDPDGTGELPTSPLEAVERVVSVLVECAPFTASLGWRVTPLKARGLLAGGPPIDLDECDDDGSPRVQDPAGFLTFVKGRQELRYFGAEGQKLS